MTYQKHHKPLWQFESWSYKRCQKCYRNTKYKDILDLYLLKDSSATWVCPYCQHSETIEIDSLIS
ncbi:MAG: hypothetical protein AAGE84_04005 [Cyanobacteria bacterium P01_G01_bin.39]